jgi:hypothetical protein
MLTYDEINALTPEEFKVYENRLRRMAKRQGLFINKSRIRDPRAIGYGGYYLLDSRTGNVELHDGQGNGVSLLDVEAYLTSDSEAA